MHKVEFLCDVWDNGAVSPDTLTGEAIDTFKEQTNAKRVVAQRWWCNGQMHEVPYFVRVLPDRSGLVHYADDDPSTGRLVVLNADGTQRLVISVPRVDERSRPEKGYIALPPSSAHFGGIEWGCEGHDGYIDYLFDFDWNTGALLRYAQPSRPW